MLGFVVLSFAAGILAGLAIGAFLDRATAKKSPATTHSVGISAIGLSPDGRGGGIASLDAHHQRLLRPILERMGREI